MNKAEAAAAVALVDADPPAEPGPKRCPACHGSDIRTKHAGDPEPRYRITYCLDCLMGTSGTGMTVDMMLFPSCIEQRRVKHMVAAAAEQS